MLKSIGIHRIVIALVVTAVVVTQSVQAQTWQSLLGPPKAREVKDIAVNKTGDTLYACDKSVLFKSTNGGSSWAATEYEISSPLAVTAKADDAKIVIIGVSNDLKRNTSTGNAPWSPVGPGGSFTPLRLSVSPISSQHNEMYMGRQAVSGQSSIYYSATSGASWSPQFPSAYQTNIHDIAPYPKGGEARDGHVWAAGSDPAGSSNENANPNESAASVRGVWHSTDRGENWTQKNMGNFNVRAIAITHQSTPFIYAGTSSGKLYRSDNGANWTNLNNSYPNSTSATIVRAIRVGDSDHVYVASDKGIHRSTDAATTWESRHNGIPIDDRNILALGMAVSDKNIMYATTAKAVYKTTNGGSTWTDASNGLGRMPVSSVAINGNNFWTTSRTYDTLGRYDGSTWSVTRDSAFYGNHIMRNPANGYIFASGSLDQKAALRRSKNGGQSYRPYYSVGSGSDIRFEGSMVSTTNSGHIWAWGKDGTNHYFSVLDSATADRTPVGNSANAVNDMIVLSSSGPTYYGKENNEAMRKCNGIPCGGDPLSLQVTIKSLSAFDANYVYAAGPSGLYRTTNGGTTWPWVTTTPLKQVLVNRHQPHGGKFVIVLRNGGDRIEYSCSGGGMTGSAWINATDTLPTPIHHLRQDEGSNQDLYAATDQGVFRIAPYNGGPTANVSPPDGELTASTTVTLQWQERTGAMGYRLEVARDDTFGNIFLNTMTSSRSYTANFGQNTRYYWRVYASNVAKEANPSVTWWFHTPSPPPPPPPPCCPYVFTFDGRAFVEDNDILPQTQYAGNSHKDVVDHYKLQSPLVSTPEGEYLIEIREWETERSYFDQIQLLAIDHSAQTEIALTKSGDFVEYTTPFLPDTVLTDVSALTKLDHHGIRTEKDLNFLLYFNAAPGQDFATVAGTGRGGVLLGGWLSNAGGK